MISTTSAYALRALAALARDPEGAYVLGRDLAAAANIPANYLSKILLALRNAGLIATARGSGGGYRLSKPARKISLIEVVDLFEKSRVKPLCLLGGRACSDHDPCIAHNFWCPVADAYAAFMNTTNLENISVRRKGAANGRRRRAPHSRKGLRGGARS